MSAIKAFFIGWATQTFLAFDQALNAVVMPIFTWSVGSADETLSARAYRSRDRPWAKVLRPVIDLLFVLQKPDPTITENGVPITSHCQRAFEKERLKRYLPPEYR